MKNTNVDTVKTPSQFRYGNTAKIAKVKQAETTQAGTREKKLETCALCLMATNKAYQGYKNTENKTGARWECERCFFNLPIRDKKPVKITRCVGCKALIDRRGKSKFGARCFNCKRLDKNKRTRIRAKKKLKEINNGKCRTYQLKSN